jgi:biotin transport system substrate-specific component
MIETRFSPRELTMVALFAALTVALGFLYIPLPFTPVPVTGQSLGIMLAGCILGKRLGTLSAVVFLSLVAIGAPVLAGGRGGLGVLFGPSGGYLFGFILAAFSLGWLAEKLHRQPGAFWRLLVAVVICGIVAVHIPGVLYLSFVTHRSLLEAMAVGSLPFLAGDLIKALAAVVITEGVYAAYPMERIFARPTASPSPEAR